MALRDTWHRTLVYFGLAEEDDGYREELEPQPEAELEDRYRERPNVRRLQARRRRDEIDDIFADEPRSARDTRVLRSVQNGGRAGVQVGSWRVYKVVPDCPRPCDTSARRCAAGPPCARQHCW